MSVDEVLRSRSRMVPLPGGLQGVRAGGRAGGVEGRLDCSEATKQVTGEAAAQASVVVGQAKEQLQSLIGETKDELDAQLSSKGEQIAGGLRNLVGQLDALANGRAAEAGPLTGYVQEARGKVDNVARRLDEGGPQAVIGDLAAFARRRPGVFLTGAAVLGFVVGRVVRAGAAASKEGMVRTGSSSSGRSLAVGPGTGGELPPPIGDELVMSVGAGSNPTMPAGPTRPGLA